MFVCSVSLPYDHTYQHIFHYGVYTRLRSALLPLTVTWHNVPGRIDTLWVRGEWKRTQKRIRHISHPTAADVSERFVFKVELEQELSSDMTGLCGNHNVWGTTSKHDETYTKGCIIIQKTFLQSSYYSQLSLLPIIKDYLHISESLIYLSVTFHVVLL